MISKIYQAIVVKATPQLLIRIGIAFTFLFAGISSLKNPSDWIWYVPDFTEIITSKNLLLLAFSIVEIILGLWLVWGKYLREAALASAIILTGITLASLNTLQITFRDIGLVLASLALLKLVKKEK